MSFTPHRISNLYIMWCLSVAALTLCIYNIMEKLMTNFKASTCDLICHGFSPCRLFYYIIYLILTWTLSCHLFTMIACLYELVWSGETTNIRGESEPNRTAERYLSRNYMTFPKIMAPGAALSLRILWEYWSWHLGSSPICTANESYYV